MNLYELPEVYKAIMAEIDDNDGELTQELEERLKNVECNIASKVDAYCAMIKQYEHDSEGLKEEMHRLKLKAQSCEATSQRLRAVLHGAMAKMDLKTIKGKRFFVRRAVQNVPKIRWTSEGPIPEQFRKTKVELDVQSAFKEYRESGGNLPEGFDVTFTEFVVIR